MPIAHTMILTLEELRRDVAMYSAPDFVKISVQQTTAFASYKPCDPEWEMNNWSLSPDCQKIAIEGMSTSYMCYFMQNPPA